MMILSIPLGLHRGRVIHLNGVESWNFRPRVCVRLETGHYRGGAAYLRFEIAKVGR